MPKIWKASDESGKQILVFECPGCGYGHNIEVPRWKWNGSMDKPTFFPSIKILPPGMRCHSWVTDGRIQFLQDCDHMLAGKTVELPEVDL